jgi:hypothetical protein
MTDTTTNTTPTEGQTEAVRVVDHSTSTTIKAIDLVPQREGVLATSTDAYGSPAQTLDDNTRVRIGSVQMPIRVALREGLLVRDQAAPEGIREATPEERQARAATETQQREMVRLPETDERNLDHLVRGFQAMGVDPITVMSDYLAHPDRLPEALSRWANHHKADPAEVQKAFLSIVSGFAKQAQDTITADGLEPAKVLAWAWDNHRHLHNGAALRAFTGSMAGWRDLANRYRDAHNLPKAKAPDGVQVLSVKDGTVTAITPNGRTMQLSVANAKRMGYIR